MAAAVLLVLLTLAMHRLLLQPFSTVLEALALSPWWLWGAGLLGVWLFAGPRRNP